MKEYEKFALDFMKRTSLTEDPGINYGLIAAYEQGFLKAREMALDELERECQKHVDYVFNASVYFSKLRSIGEEEK